MKYIVAVTQPYKLEDIQAGLKEIGVQAMTVTEVKGYGRQKGQKEIYRGAEYDVSFVPKVRIEIAVPASAVDDIVRVITEKAHTGNIGDGKVFVLPLDSAQRIRTGETGEEAL